MPSPELASTQFSGMGWSSSFGNWFALLGRSPLPAPETRVQTGSEASLTWSRQAVEQVGPIVVPLQDDSLNNGPDESNLRTPTRLMEVHQREEHKQARLLEYEHTLHENAESAICEKLRLVATLAQCREYAERKGARIELNEAGFYQE